MSNHEEKIITIFDDKGNQVDVPLSQYQSLAKKESVLKDLTNADKFLSTTINNTTPLFSECVVKGLKGKKFTVPQESIKDFQKAVTTVNELVNMYKVLVQNSFGQMDAMAYLITLRSQNTVH